MYSWYLPSDEVIWSGCLGPGKASVTLMLLVAELLLQAVWPDEVDASTFTDEPKTTRQSIFSAKAGGIHASYFRDLRGVIGREKAAIGVLITMEQPARPMRSEAA